ILTVIAGMGIQGFSGDGGPATSAQLYGAWGLVVDGSGNLLIADTGNSRIRKITRDGVIRTIAGNGMPGFSGDGGPATSAQLNPVGLAMDGSGNLFIVDAQTGRIRKV